MCSIYAYTYTKKSSRRKFPQLFFYKCFKLELFCQRPNSRGVTLDHVIEVLTNHCFLASENGDDDDENGGALKWYLRRRVNRTLLISVNIFID